MGAAGTEAKHQNLGTLEACRRQPAAPFWSVFQATLPIKAAIDASGIGRLSRTEPFPAPASAFQKPLLRAWFWRIAAR